MSEIAAHRGISIHRIQAMVLRYWYLLMSSWPRLLELIYWPALQIITWGFLQSYIAQNDSFFARAGGTLIGAVSRPARLLDFVSRRDVGAQPRQPDDEPVKADRIPDLADDHEPDPARDRRHPDDAAGAVLLRF
jgi:hypothetical protein